jgi:hypothetical protein
MDQTGCSQKELSDLPQSDGVTQSSLLRLNLHRLSRHIHAGQKKRKSLRKMDIFQLYGILVQIAYKYQ